MTQAVMLLFSYFNALSNLTSVLVLLSSSKICFILAKCQL